MTTAVERVSVEDTALEGEQEGLWPRLDRSALPFSQPASVEMRQLFWFYLVVVVPLIPFRATAHFMAASWRAALFFPARSATHCIPSCAQNNSSPLQKAIPRSFIPGATPGPLSLSLPVKFVDPHFSKVY